MNVAAIIVGIDGWERYTLPLIESIQQHEPACHLVVVDNASKPPYPPRQMFDLGVQGVWTSRRCYSAAINTGKASHGLQHDPDWYIVLSNDVLCTGPFAHILEQYTNGDLVGPCLKQTHGYDYLEGWCVCVPAQTWQPWDERFLGSDWEDADYSQSALERGFGLQHEPDLPFVHLDQKQRFSVVPDFWSKDVHNRNLFLEKHRRRA